MTKVIKAYKFMARKKVGGTKVGGTTTSILFKNASYNFFV